ncbi:MAG: hypothetical protein ABSC06_11750 [Rhodopila sp.]|jgi:hypothetical protein
MRSYVATIVAATVLYSMSSVNAAVKLTDSQLAMTVAGDDGSGNNNGNGNFGNGNGNNTNNSNTGNGNSSGTTTRSSQVTPNPRLATTLTTPSTRTFSTFMATHPHPPMFMDYLHLGAQNGGLLGGMLPTAHGG